MTIELLSSAYNDLKKGQIFYEEQANDLGDYFFDALFSEIDSLMLYAGIHQKVFGYHRLLSKRFPYAIYYKTGGTKTIVYRVLDCRQEPQKIAEQLT